jgi:DNA-binding SARP family transcriptional activator
MELPSQLRAFLTYLETHPEGVSREELLRVFWHEESPRTRNSLRVALSRLRRLLPPGALAEPPLRLVPERWSSPQLRFELAFRQAMALPEEKREAALKAALDLHPQASEFLGPYLELQSERARLACQARDCPLAVEALAAMIKAEPWIGEDLYRQLIGCLSVVEGPCSAIELYRRLKAFLKRELGEEPLPETQALAERVRRGERVCQPIQAGVEW